MDASHWQVDLGHRLGPLVLGDERSAVLARLAEAKIEVEPDDDPTWLYIPEMEAELTFSRDEPRKLLQISVEDERLRFGTLPVLGRRLHEIVDMLNVPESETLWRPGEDPARELAEGDEHPLPPLDDEKLVDMGILWIITLGLGLAVWRGEIVAVYLRQPQDSPRRGLGPFLPRHAELSRAAEQPEPLAKSPPAAARPPGWFGTLTLLALVAALAIVIWQAVRYQQRWNAAARVEGQIVAVKPPPPDPFPTEFTVTYQDQTGKRHEVVLDLAGVNDARHMGDKVDLCYLPEAPDRAMGFASSRDAAFEKFIPWGIGVFVAFAALQFAAMATRLLRGRG